MKQPKKLTRNQKEILVKKGMNPDDYMLHSEDEKEISNISRRIMKSMQSSILRLIPQPA